MPDAEFKRVRDGDRARAEDLIFAYNPGAIIQGRYYMAVEDDAIKGVVGLLWRSWYLTELRHLFVKPEFRRQGIGTFLVEKALKKVRTPLACCTVRDGNEGSPTLLRRAGFIVERRFVNPETENTVSLLVRPRDL